MQATTIRSIFVNLPIKDIGRTRAFWTALGFSFDEHFSDDHALCLVLRENTAYAMLLSDPFFASFTNRPLADGTTTQVLLAIAMASREQVDEVTRLALEQGATAYMQPEDMGWMYTKRFSDPDGHLWEVTYMDEGKIPQA